MSPADFAFGILSATSTFGGPALCLWAVTMRRPGVPWTFIWLFLSGAVGISTLLLLPGSGSSEGTLVVCFLTAVQTVLLSRAAGELRTHRLRDDGGARKDSGSDDAPGLRR